jgi:LPXTG-motif cell wall-anchored protein
VTPTPSPTPDLVPLDADDSDDDELPKTGDNNALMIWLGIMAAAIVLLIGVATVGKRRVRGK